MRPALITDATETLSQIEGLAHIQCTHAEAADVMGVARSTFTTFLTNNKKAAEAWERGLSKGKASLRRLQFKNAENGSATMQIWLGKQWLEQADQAVNTIDVGATLGGLLGKLTGSVLPDHALEIEMEEKTIPESLVPSTRTLQS